MRILLTRKDEPYANQAYNADVIINVKTGKVLKNRFGVNSDVIVTFDKNPYGNELSDKGNV